MKAGDVVWVPFPHVEDKRLRPRPALVVATDLGGSHALFWALMITSADNDAWPGDVLIGDHESAGLPIPSRIRTEKIATLAVGSANYIGRLSPPSWLEVQDRVTKTLA